MRTVSWNNECVRLGGTMGAHGLATKLLVVSLLFIDLLPTASFQGEK